MNGKIFIVGTCAFALGLYVGSMHLRSAQEPPATTPPTGLEKLQSLAEVDLEDYYRLKTMEEKYLKADEILGKIMVIFLADLGLRVSRQAQEAAQTRAVITDRHSDPPPKTAPAPASLPSDPAKAMPSAELETSLLALRDERAIVEQLQKVRISDLATAIRGSTLFTNRDDMLSVINGNFEGRARVREKGKPDNWYLHLEVAASMQKGSLSGSVKSRLLKNGKVFSNSTSNGDKIEAFREFTGGSSALLVKASPTVYLQVYHLKELDQLAVNLYKRSDESEDFDMVGSAALKRAH